MQNLACCDGPVCESCYMLRQEQAVQGRCRSHDKKKKERNEERENQHMEMMAWCKSVNISYDQSSCKSHVHHKSFQSI